MWRLGKICKNFTQTFHFLFEVTALEYGVKMNVNKAVTWHNVEQTKRCEYFPDVVSDRVSDRVDALLKGAAVWRKEAVTRVYAESRGWKVASGNSINVLLWTGAEVC